MAAEVRKETRKNIHVETVRRTLQRAGYSSRIARKKPLSKANKKRVDFTKAYAT